MKIGILKEPNDENRVMFLPEHVTKLAKNKIEIIIEKSAGERAFISDVSYTKAGAKVTDKKQVLQDADVIGRISPPDDEDIKTIGEGKILISVMNPYVDHDVVKAIQGQKITGFSLDVIPRTTRAQAMDVLSSMATIAGYKAVLEAALQLPNFFPMFMSAAGTIKPSKVLILGAGVAGLQAIASAKKLGAVVEVFDVRAAVKEEVESLGGKFIEVEGAKDEASAGGYAVEQSEEFKKKQQQAIHDHAVKANVVIATAQIPGKKAPLLIPKKTVEEMMPGSVIIDLAASTGGNCELSENNKATEHNGVKIIGNSNYASSMPNDASRMFGNNVINFVNILVDQEGNLALNFEDELVAGTCVTHQGEIVNERVKTLIK